jgi:hypothetical protein
MSRTETVTQKPPRPEPSIPEPEETLEPLSRYGRWLTRFDDDD